MATKTISIMDDAYEILVRNKRNNESFSEELRRILPKRGSIVECDGLWKDITDKQANDMEKAIKKSREYTRKHILERIK